MAIQDLCVGQAKEDHNEQHELGHLYRTQDGSTVDLPQKDVRYGEEHHQEKEDRGNPAHHPGYGVDPPFQALIYLLNIHKKNSEDSRRMDE
jgi:hypothetical protein